MKNDLISNGPFFVLTQDGEIIKIAAWEVSNNRELLESRKEMWEENYRTNPHTAIRPYWMDEIPLATWEVRYISCEGNERWYNKEVPNNWEEWQVRESIQIGGCGDDIAEIISLERK